MSLAHAALMHPLSVAQFLALWEQGALGANDRVELIDGEIRQMTPIGPRHSVSTSRLTARLFKAIHDDQATIRCQLPVQVTELDMPQPDVAVCVPGDYWDRHPAPSELLLVVEVADTTERADRRDMLPLYAAASIPELWLVLPARRIVEVHHNPDPAARVYRSITIHQPGDVIAPLAFPDAQIAVADFLPPEANP